MRGPNALDDIMGYSRDFLGENTFPESKARVTHQMIRYILTYLVRMYLRFNFCKTPFATDKFSDGWGVLDRS